MFLTSPYPWYPARLVAPRTWAISDNGSDVFYLLYGEQKALLIDTGFGFGDLKALVKALLPADMPLLVANTHGHLDHVMGNWQFDEVYVSAGDRYMVNQPVPANVRQDILREFNSQYPAEWKPALSQPEEFQLKWGVLIPSTILTFQEGFIFDLGGRTLEVIELPGHTQGSICLLDRQERLLFSGDGIHNGHIWLQLEESTSLRAYLQALYHLRKWEGSYDWFQWGHKQLPAPAKLIDKLIPAIHSILDHQSVGEPYHTFLGDDALRLEFDGGSIVYNPLKLE